MSKPNRRAPSLAALPVIILLSTGVFAQNRTLPEEDWYGDIKKALATYYTGKQVRLKLPIPGTRRGLEMMDGILQSSASPNQPPAVANIGDELIIKALRVSDSDIEFMLGKNEPPPKKRFSDMFSSSKAPRITLRSSRELTSKDLTIDNINRMLAVAIDISSLIPPVAEKPVDNPETSNGSPQPEAAPKNDEQINEQNYPKPHVVRDVPALAPLIGELTVEASATRARVYIDGSYSGLAPRTIRLRSGVHTILIVIDGYTPWEQKLFIPGGKASIIRAEPQRAMR